MIVAVAFGVVGLVFLVLGLSTMATQRRFARIAERTEGTIVSLRTRVRQRSGTISAGADSVGGPTMRSSRVYLPTVTFTTRSGRTVTAESTVGSNPPPGRVGESVRVLYDPADPERVRIDSLLGRGGCVGVVFVTIGTVFVVAAAIAVTIISGSGAS